MTLVLSVSGPTPAEAVSGAPRWIARGHRFWRRLLPVDAEVLAVGRRLLLLRRSGCTGHGTREHSGPWFHVNGRVTVIHWQIMAVGQYQVYYSFIFVHFASTQVARFRGQLKIRGSPKVAERQPSRPFAPSEACEWLSEHPPLESPHLFSVHLAPTWLKTIDEELRSLRSTRKIEKANGARLTSTHISSG